MKAFVINVVGDVGMVLAALFILRELGTLDLEGIFAAAEGFTVNQGVAIAICLLMVGAFAKSAQVPLHPGSPTRWRARRRSPP